MLDLNSLLLPDSDWELVMGRYINNAGQIIRVHYYTARSPSKLRGISRTCQF